MYLTVIFKINLYLIGWKLFYNLVLVSSSPPASWETCEQVQKQQLELDTEKWTGSKLGKECIKAINCHPAYLLYAECILQNAGLDESQAGIKISGRNIKNLRYAVDTTQIVESEEELKRLLRKVKEGSKIAGLKFNFHKTKIMASSPITSCQIDAETVETVTDLFSWAPKSLWMVTAAMKLKDTCSLGEKLWQV